MNNIPKFSTSFFMGITAIVISIMGLLLYRMLYRHNIGIMLISMAFFSILIMAIKNNWEKFDVAR